MESNKKYVILGGLILVLTFGLFGTYVHFTKQDVLIGGSNNGDIIKKQSNSKTKKANIEDSSENTDNKNTTNDTVNAEVSEGETNNNEAAENITVSEETFIEYTVVKGDTISGIWKKNIVSYTFNRAKEVIISKNNLSSADNLKLGQKLKIPSRNTKGYKKYTVKKADTITDIAKQCLPRKELNEAIDLITKANGKYNVDNLEPEQVLLIPTV